MKRILVAFIGMLIFVGAFAHCPKHGHEHEMDDRTCPVCNGAGTCQPAGYRGSNQNKTYCWGSGKCGFCGGEGYTYVAGDRIKCVTCQGTGKCAKCNGTGKCHNCHGTGKVGSHSSGAGTRASSDDSSYSGSSSSGSGYSGSSFLSEDATEGLAIAIAAVALIPITFVVAGVTSIQQYKEYTPMFPDLQVKAGWSYLLGEHASVKTHLGGQGGVVLTGGVGRELLTKLDYHDGVNSFLGIGWYLCDGINSKWDFSWTIDLIMTSQRYETPIGFTNMELSRYLGRDGRHGAFVGIGAGYGSNFVADIRIGYLYKLRQW